MVRRPYRQRSLVEVLLPDADKLWDPALRQIDTLLARAAAATLRAAPAHTAYATRQILEQVESLDRQVAGFEHRIKSVFNPTRAIQLLTTLPGVGLTLAVVIALEVGDVTRFSHCREARQLRRMHLPRPRDRWQAALRAPPPGRQPLPQVGVQRSRERDLSDARPPPAPPRQSPLRAHRPAQGPSQRHRRRGSASGGSHVWLLSKQQTYLEPQASAVRLRG
jgi:Transposase IS116/IS110/IS902 family